MFHELLRTWFEWVEAWGYLGVFVLMAMESSIIPVPSEIVMPPAAFWASQGKMSFWGVVLAGTGGSYLGSVVSYALSAWVGEPLIQKYGRWIFLSPEKIKWAQDWMSRHGFFGIFLARLLPVVRHLISIPAGFLKMSLSRFSVATVLGAGLWCFVLSWLGQVVIGAHPELLQSPEDMVAVIKVKLHWIIAVSFVFFILYIFVNRPHKQSHDLS